MKTAITLVLFYCSWISSSLGQSSNVLSISQAAVIPVESTGITNHSNRDLAFLDTLLRDKRIVFLGEANHGDGSTIIAKAKIIRYLTEVLHFKVVVFEEPFYSMTKANELLKDKTIDPRSILNECFGSQVLIEGKIRDYLIPSLLGKRGIEIRGVDLIGVGPLQDLLARDLRQMDIKNSLVKKYINGVDSLNYMMLSGGDKGETNRYRETFNFAAFDKASSEVLHELSNINDKRQERASRLMQVLRSNSGLAEWVRLGPGPVKLHHHTNNENVNDYHRLRDKAMGNNLLWLISNEYPNDRIIVSTSTYHISRGLYHYPVMVDYLPDSIVNSSYIMPFITYQGTRGFETPVEGYSVRSFKSDSSSLELKLHSLNIKFGLVDFGRLSSHDKNLLNRYSMHPSDQPVFNVKWTEHFNGVFFIDKMEPQTITGFSISDNQKREVLRKKLKALR
ncbi:hypothetical protein BH10BAC4_BH10BAC4_26950 [soil metagenome]